MRLIIYIHIYHFVTDKINANWSLVAQLGHTPVKQTNKRYTTVIQETASCVIMLKVILLHS